MDTWLERHRFPLFEQTEDGQWLYALIYDNGFRAAAFLRDEKVGEFASVKEAAAELSKLDSKIPDDITIGDWNSKTIITGIVRGAAR